MKPSPPPRPTTAQPRETADGEPTPSAEKKAHTEAEPVENELRCTLCGLRACWTN